jgi:hypothetical protein
MGITQYPFPSNIRYGTSNVATSQTTTSSTYVALATAQEVTIATGTSALVILTATMSNNTTGGDTYMSFAISGATTLAAADAQSVGTDNGAARTRISSATIVTLTPGINTFAARFKVESGNTGTFANREITVIPLD